MSKCVEINMLELLEKIELDIKQVHKNPLRLWGKSNVSKCCPPFDLCS